MPVADYLKPDTSSQLKKSSEILTEYLKAKQQAALFNASRASMDKDGNFNERMYRQSAMAGGVNPTEAAAGVPQMYELQQRMAIEKAREEYVRRQAQQIGSNPDGSPITAQPGTVDTGRLAVDPGLHAANATSLALDQEQQRVIETQKRNQEAALAAINAQAMGAKPVSGVGTPEANATSVEQTLYNVRGDQSQGGPVEHYQQDLTKLSADTAKDYAYGLRSRGLYAGNDVPGPQMQAGYNKHVAQVYADIEASRPKITQFGGDFAKFKTAEREWEAKKAGVPAKLAEEAATWRNDRQANATSRLGNAATRQGMNIAKTEFDQTQAAIQDAWQNGYKGVSKGNVGEYQKLQTDMNWLRNTSEGAADIIKEVNETGNLDATKFQALLKNLEQAPMSADKITDIGGREQLSSLFAARKDVQQVIRNSNTVGELAKNLAKNEFATDQQARVAQLIKDMVDHQMKHGNTASALEALRVGKKTAKTEIERRIESAIPKVGANGEGWDKLKNKAWYVGPDGKKHQKGVEGY